MTPPKVVILCGGQGTRMKEETEFKPKPLVDIGGRPMLWHIMKGFAHHGLTDFVLCLGYKGNMIKEYFLIYEAMNNDFTISLGHKSRITYHGAHLEQDYQVTLLDTGAETMTGGRVLQTKKHITGDTFIVTYGDGVSNVDIPKLLAFHKQHGKVATVTTVQPVSRFGVLETDKKGKIVSFAEKPQLDGWVNAGFMVFNREFFKYLDGDETVLERAPLERLAKKGELMAYRHDGFFFAMDTYREYKHLNDLWAQGEAPWKVWK